MSDSTTPSKRLSTRNAHKNNKAVPLTKKRKSGEENDGNTNTNGTEDEDHGEVEVVRVYQGVDRREQQRRLEMEEEEEDDEGIEEVPTNGTGERQAIQKSARDILMGGFMDLEHGENENNGSLSRNVVRPEIQGQNRQVVEGAVTRELNKALSHRAAGHCREKHMTDRVVDYCKTQLFRKVKFITGEEMTALALTTVMDALNIVAPERPNFVKLYTTCVTGSINTKRSTCEQAGAKIVRDLLIQKQHKPENNGGPPYRMESLVKLRRSYDGSAEDLEAFVWFLGTFLDCVSGARAWGGQRKYVEEVLKAEIKGVGGKIKLVTVSDEAFGLLLYENYVDKWIQKYHHERRTLLPSMLSTAEKKKLGATKMRGKYTTGSVGNCEFGGWSEKGMRRFNELCDTVAEDRNDPKAQIMEGYLLKEIRRKKYGETVPAIESDDDSINDLLNGAPAVRAYCEL